jgi:inosose dehydratase
MRFELGIGPDSWGVWFPSDPRQPPFEQFLDEANRAGYRTIELGPFGYLPTNPDTLRRLLDAYNFRLSGGFIFGDFHTPDSWERRKAEIDAAAPLLQALGAQFCVLIESMYTDLFTGEQIAEPELSQEEWTRLAENSNRIGAYALERYGLKVAFHPHAQTHIEREDQIERYLDMTDPSVVSMCLDTGHHAYCGGDPVSFMRNHHDRIPYLHIKSVDQGIRAEVAARGIPFAEAVKMGAFNEPKDGVIDFVAFRQVLEEVGFEGIGIVEQDLYPTAFDRPFPIAVSTRRYLSDIGMA